jgi:hypothetical protein
VRQILRRTSPIGHPSFEGCYQTLVTSRELLPLSFECISLERPYGLSLRLPLEHVLLMYETLLFKVREGGPCCQFSATDPTIWWDTARSVVKLRASVSTVGCEAYPPQRAPDRAPTEQGKEFHVSGYAQAWHPRASLSSRLPCPIVGCRYRWVDWLSKTTFVDLLWPFFPKGRVIY